MFKVAIITEEETFAERLYEYWKTHCGKEIELVDKCLIDECKLILCDEDLYEENFKEKKVVLLVSEAEKVKEPNKLLKYGKPQELYEKVLKLCNSKEELKAEKDNLITRQVGKETVLEYKCEKEKIDKYALGILEKCPIEGIAPLFRESEEQKNICFYIHGKITLEDFLKMSGTERQVLQILKDIFDILINVEDYMLDRNQIVLDINHIYLHQITRKPLLIYLPDNENNDKDWIKKYQNLLTQLSYIDFSKANSNEYFKLELPGNLSKPLMVKEEMQYNGRTEYFQSMQMPIVEKKKMAMIKYPKLVWNKNGNEIVVDRKIFKIGKEKKYVDFCISDNPAVSRNHADILIQDNKFYIVDKESLNHTYVNGEQIVSNKKIELRDKDMIRLANEDFVFRE